MSMIYPTIENANEILREKCFRGLTQKLPSDKRAEAEKKLEEELDIIKRQGSASGFLTVSNALDAVISQTDKICCRGTLGVSFAAHLLGFSFTCPIGASPTLYPEFLYELRGDKLPWFEFSVSQTLYSKLMEYFDDYPGKDKFERKRSMDDLPYGVALKCSNATDEDTIFNANFFTIDDEDKLKEKIFSNDIASALNAKSRSDFVRVNGLLNGTGTWEDNAEDLIRTGMASGDEVIAHREDVYEYLLGKEIDKKNAFEIAEYVRKGRARKRGWRPEMLDLMKDHAVPEWYIHSCEKIKYLFPRAHSMETLAFLEATSFKD